jgi:hypothetical protein
MTTTRKPRRSSDFKPLGCTHIPGGMTSLYGTFSADEVAAAENVMRSDPTLAMEGVAKIAHLMRKIQASKPATVPTDAQRIETLKREVADLLADMRRDRGSRDD